MSSSIHKTTPAVPAPDDLAQPTEHDQALVAQIEGLRGQAPLPPIAQEVLFGIDTSESRYYWSHLTGAAPSTEQNLTRARRHFRNVLHRVEQALSWKEPAPYRVPRRRGPIAIDGNLNEPDWQRARPINIDQDTIHIPPRQFDPAIARVLWDEKFLYYGFDVTTQGINAPVMERNDEVYTYDCVEVFILGQHRFGVYWEINVSPSGSIFDALLCKYRHRSYSYCRPEEDIHGMLTAHKLRGPRGDYREGDPVTGYTVEIAVPFDEVPCLPRRPLEGMTIYGLLGMNRTEGEGEERHHNFISHAPSYGSFHNIFAYTPFLLADE